ncbi:MAG: ATP synthase F0 subunit C [Bryobacteraceae bacterium]|nr:ATP synthase F0 subunit C [Bryobacteraceae bacterium]
MNFKTVWMLLALLLVASPVFAQDAQHGTDLRPLAAGLSMAIASGLCGLGQGKAVAHAAEAMARNPGAIAAIRGALLLGLVLIESLALYTLVIVFLKT